MQGCISRRGDLPLSVILFAPLAVHARSFAEVKAGLLEGRKITDGLKHLASAYDERHTC